ncbi:RNA polymerase sigma factor [uncultured Paraglaciecola sp.]|uniref:RNA polymerase sigma factor n=1 Tax=uncultured Paraglaciecola sp. TaxID=1765024 RepID=UPI00262936C0|nr:RNA polymerase sigma factor [uncultured Paraglaciecola sp.]
MKSQLFAQLYQQFWPELCAKLQHRFGSGPPDPEDIAQQAFVKYSELSGQHRIENPRAFIYTMARNLFIDQFRRNKKQQLVIEKIFIELGMEPMVEVSAEQAALKVERNRLIEKAIAKLDEKQHKLMTMSIVEGKSYRQIATDTGLPISNISRTISAAQNLIDEFVNFQEEPHSALSNLRLVLKERV